MKYPKPLPIDTFDARDPLAIAQHDIKLLTERLDWLEIQVRGMQERIEKMEQKSEKAYQNAIDARFPQA